MTVSTFHRIQFLEDWQAGLLSYIPEDCEEFNTFLKAPRRISFWKAEAAIASSGATPLFYARTARTVGLLLEVPGRRCRSLQHANFRGLVLGCIEAN